MWVSFAQLQLLFIKFDQEPRKCINDIGIQSQVRNRLLAGTELFQLSLFWTFDEENIKYPIIEKDQESVANNCFPHHMQV